MIKKILITGATGLIGKSLVDELVNMGAFIKILTTSPDKASDIFKRHYTIQIFDMNKYREPTALSELLEDTDSVINLAGENVSRKRWNKNFKQALYSSRIDTTKLIVDAMGYCKNKPESLISASGVGYYGFCGDEIIKGDANPGNDFLAELCRDWEIEALKAIQFDVRVVIMRTGIVLSNKEGALKEFLTPFKFGFGVYQGSGKQWLSWIHINDIIKLYIFAIDNSKLYGAYNATSPNPVTNKEFTKSLSQTLNRGIVLPAPGIILRIVMGEFANNILTGQRVYPEKALDAGFQFEYPELKDALNELLKNSKSNVN